ncbi:LOW QUALITY PROTEIN: hypothetical protein PHMEG_00021367 [Phytophthora megakarya]|uniref:Uncharacterized protein n=1 Tax=Phytophthora megakarya TaxID=4795 RepID=A0A225VNQ4_9STRA|nr:LOW QUALITY PROTEIN: hypothetical protein PHMEG_00021367 [Phytophthora megakarya]
MGEILGRRPPRVSDSPPLRASTHAALKPIPDATLTEARKGKKNAAKRTSPVPIPIEPEKNSDWGTAVNVGVELDE